MHSNRFFRIKLIARLILKREISGSHTISDQSLLLSTFSFIKFVTETVTKQCVHIAICSGIGMYFGLGGQGQPESDQFKKLL